jgi:hypothetical protein
MHSNTRKLRTKPWIFYWSYYKKFRGSNISNPIFFYWLLKWRNYLPPYFTYNHVGTYFQCYGRSNEFIIFTLKELNWTYFLSHVVSKIPIVISPWEYMAKILLARHIYLSMMKSVNTHSFIGCNSYKFVSKLQVIIANAIMVSSSTIKWFIKS